MMTLAKLKTGLLAFAMVGSLGLATVAVSRTIGADGQEPSNAESQPAVAPKPSDLPAAKQGVKAPPTEAKVQEDPKPVEPKAHSKYIPRPSSSTVQIQLDGEKSTTASGTIISSTPEESIILTSARVFPTEAVKLNVKLSVPGKLRGNLQEAASVIETSGELIDRDLTHNVALVRIHPGREALASPIVPRNWKPSPGANMIAMRGRPEDKTSQFLPCQFIDVLKGEGENAGYEALHCKLLPKRSSEGSGLFTSGHYGDDGFLAGVCNFGFPQSDTSLYASPKMIYSILDKNGLSSLYQDEDPRLSPVPEPEFDLQEVVEPRAISLLV